MRTPTPEELAILEATEHMRPEVTHHRLWVAGFRGWSWQRIMEWRESRDTEEVTDA